MANILKSHVDLLGRSAIDKVTGFVGIITTVSFDLYGCIQVVITPRIDEKGEWSPGKWFDVSRLYVNYDDQPVMSVPDFSQGYIAEGKKGAAEKPML